MHTKKEATIIIMNMNIKGTHCLGSVELVFEKCLEPFVMKCIWLEKVFKSRI